MAICAYKYIEGENHEKGIVLFKIIAKAKL
mgnify:CR=1 FL=1